MPPQEHRISYVILTSIHRPLILRNNHERGIGTVSGICRILTQDNFDAEGV